MPQEHLEGRNSLLHGNYPQALFPLHRGACPRTGNKHVGNSTPEVMSSLQVLLIYFIHLFHFTYILSTYHFQLPQQLAFSKTPLNSPRRTGKKWKWSQLLSCVWLFATPWTVTHQASLSLGILQARILEWVAIPFSRGSSQPRDQTRVSCFAGRFCAIWATREALCRTEAILK